MACGFCPKAVQTFASVASKHTWRHQPHSVALPSASARPSGERLRERVSTSLVQNAPQEQRKHLACSGTARPPHPSHLCQQHLLISIYFWREGNPSMGLQEVRPRCDEGEHCRCWRHRRHACRKTSHMNASLSLALVSSLLTVCRGVLGGSWDGRCVEFLAVV